MRGAASAEDGGGFGGGACAGGAGGEARSLSWGIRASASAPSMPRLKLPGRRLRTSAKGRDAPILLVCIEHMLEAWLLADERALSATIPPKAHPARVRVTAPGGNPDKIQNPKRRLIEAFQRHSGKPYNDRLHAAQIARAIPDCTRLRHSPSVRHFAKALSRAPLKTHC